MDSNKIKDIEAKLKCIVEQNKQAQKITMNANRIQPGSGKVIRRRKGAPDKRIS